MKLNLKFKKLFLISSLILITFLLVKTSPGWAQTPATEESKAVEAIRKDVEEKIQETIKTTSEQKKGYFGKIVDLYNQTIVLETQEGKKTAKVDQDTSLIGQERQKIKFEDLAIGDYLIIMGYLESADKYLAKRLVITPKPKEISQVAMIGRVTKISKTKITLQSLKNSDSLEANLTSKTKINQKVDSEIKEVNLSEIEEQTLVVVAGIKKDDLAEARVIYLLSEKTTEPTTTISPNPTKSSTPTKEITPQS